MKNTGKLEKRVYDAVCTLLKRDGFISYPELYREMHILNDNDLLEWRKGKVPFLERVVYSSLSKLTRISKVVRKIARDKNLKR